MASLGQRPAGDFLPKAIVVIDFSSLPLQSALPPPSWERAPPGILRGV